MKIIPYDAKSGVRQFEQLNRAVDAVKLKVPIAGIFELESAAKAHQRLAEGHILGKLLLQIDRS